MNRAQRRRLSQIMLGSAFALVFVFLIMRQVDGVALAAAIGSARVGWIAAGVALFLSGYTFRVLRWRAMLVNDNPNLGFVTCAVPFMTSVAANNVLPLRAGDVLRAMAFSRWLEVPTSVVVATLFVERLLDMLSLLIILGLALALIDVPHNMVSILLGASASLLVGIGLLIIATLLLPHAFERPARALAKLVGRASDDLGARVDSFIDRLFATLRHLAHGPRMVKLVVLSGIAWGFEGATFWAVAKAVTGISHPVASWLALPVGTLSTLIPSTPGYIGTFDFFVLKSTEMLGNPVGAAAAFAILIHVVLWLPATLIGGITFAVSIAHRQGPARFNRQGTPK